MTEEQRHQLSKAAGLTKLFNDVLHGKPEVQAQAIESLHWVASHASFLLDLIGEGDGVEADQRRVLIKEHSRQSIEWPVLLHADNLGKKHQAPPEVLKMRKLPLGEATSLKLYGEGGKRGVMKDVLFEFLLSFIRRVEGIRGLKKEADESPFLAKTFKELDPTGELRGLHPLTANTAKEWARVICVHCEATGGFHRMTEGRIKHSKQYDWNRRGEIWFIAGVNKNSLDWDSLFSLVPVVRTREEMNALFLSRRQVEAAHGFPIRWDDFEKTFSCELHHLKAPNEILEPLLAFSRDESSLRSTYSIKDEITRRLGVRFRYIDDQCLPKFYYDKTMAAEDIFFRDFLPAKIDWCVCDPVKFAAWVLGDRRWAVMTTVHAI